MRPIHLLRNHSDCETHAPEYYFFAMRNPQLVWIAGTIASMMLSFSMHGQLGEALNAAELTWTSGFKMGSFDSNVTTSTTHDGSQTVQSRHLFSGSFPTATLETSVTGPGTLSFWSLIPLFSPASLNIVFGSATQAVIFPSDGAWKQQTFFVGAGTQTLRWIYTLQPGPLSAQACFLDEVSYIPGSTAPFITNQPPSQSQVPGVSTIFRVGAAGTPPLNFQWQLDGTNIPGATESSLTVTNTRPMDLGTYRVIVTNSVDSIISSNATLEFGDVTSWGYDVFGETAVPPGATNIIAVAAGRLFNLALRSDGTVLGWGDNQSGQTTIPAEATNTVGIAAGSGHALGLKADGTVIAWGNNNFGQINVPPGLSNVVSLKGGLLHSLALRSDGNIVAWGANTRGQTNVPIEATNVVAISSTAASDSSLALTFDGRVFAWGGSFAEVPPGLSNVVGIAAGIFHNAVLKADGTVFVWGTGGFGVTNVPSGLTNVVQLQAGGAVFNVALTGDGNVVAWGSGPTNVPSGLSNVVMISMANIHSIGLVGHHPPVQNDNSFNPVFSTDGFCFELPSESGRVYAPQYRESLAGAEWNRLPLVAGNGTNVFIADPGATNSHRFYRVLHW
jgi:hypothetical protein